jgi:hypothetical protein
MWADEIIIYHTLYTHIIIIIITDLVQIINICVRRFGRNSSVVIKIECHSHDSKAER